MSLKSSWKVPVSSSLQRL